MDQKQITEDMIFECFAAAKSGSDGEATAKSFVDVEEYENKVMYPEFARWAKKAGYPKVAELFLKVAGEEKLHSIWLRELYQELGSPEAGEETTRATAALTEIQAHSDRLIAMNAEQVIENALKVAIRVETREFQDIYPRFRDEALTAGNSKAAGVYQRVIDSERTHALWFQQALTEVQVARMAS